MNNSKPRVLLSAFGIHTGGGLVLLKALMGAIGTKLDHALIDARLTSQPFPEHATKIVFVKKSIVSRILSLIALSKKSAPSNIMFCFNSLPPLTKSTCKVIVFVHAPHFANLHKGIQYSPVTKLRIFFERMWFKFGINNCDEIWVQTISMAESIKLECSNKRIRILPFVDDALLRISPREELVTNKIPELNNHIFFYPADAVGHKNHENLLKAWVILHAKGYHPKLLLSLTDEELHKILSRIGLEIKSLPNIINLGRLARGEVLKYLKESSALLFPSLAETFGLPLVEASHYHIPIVASEKDFVRDVCIPVETFDPNSPRSISRAILRFMKESEIGAPLISASQIIDFLLDSDLNNCPQSAQIISR